MRARFMFAFIALALAPPVAADPSPTDPAVADVVSHWRAAVHAEAGRGGVRHWRQRVEEDGLTRTDDIWIDRNGRYRTRSASEFSADDELLAGAVAEYRDWDGFVRDLDGNELQRLRRDAFSAGVLAFGPTASGFAQAEAEGFHQNDVIAGVDARMAGQFRLSELRDIVSRPGEHHVFHLRRGDHTLDIAAEVTTVSVER